MKISNYMDIEIGCIVVLDHIIKMLCIYGVKSFIQLSNYNLLYMISLMTFKIIILK